MDNPFPSRRNLLNAAQRYLLEPTEEARAAVYSMPGYAENGEYYDGNVFGAGTGQAVPLDDYDYRGSDFR